MPLVTVIIPTFNNQDTVIRAISSCLEQSFSDLEVLVIDNGSTDKTEELIGRLSDGRVKLLKLSKPNRSKARNLGLSKARGVYIQFLDSDDTLYPNKIGHDIKLLESNTPYFAISDGYRYISGDKTEDRSSSDNIGDLLGHNIFHISSVLFRNDNVKKFDENISYCEDWLFWVENLSNKKVLIDNEFIGTTQINTGKNTMRNQKIMLEYQMLIRARIRKRFKTNLLMLLKNDMVLMLTFILYCEGSKKFDYIVREYWIIYIICRVVLVTPVVGKKIKSKVKSVVDSNDFNF